MPGDEASAFVRSQGVGVAEPTVTPYPETWRDRIAQGIAGDSQGGSYWRGVAERVMGSSGLGHTSMGGADAPIVGNVFGANDAYTNNDLPGVFLNAAGLVPYSMEMSRPLRMGVGAGLFETKRLFAPSPPPDINKHPEQR
jgi:hypothetical protein